MIIIIKGNFHYSTFYSISTINFVISERQLNHSCQKSIFEGSFIDSTSQDYITPPSVNYDNISKNIDANLAQIDMETFRAQDINDVFQNNHLYAKSKTCDESISMR